MLETSLTPPVDLMRPNDPPGSYIDLISGQQPAPVRVSHVADVYRRYPGERVTFYTQVELLAAQPHLTVRVSLPHGLTLGDYRADPALAGLVPYVEIDKSGRHLLWTLAAEQPAGTRYEFQAEARVAPVQRKLNFESRAVVISPAREILAEESVTLAVEPKSSYLNYLPELYEQDDFMGRFLMLFESFWSPIDTQIDSVAHYFDPRLTPAGFLPWLASWLDLELDESWPEERRRQLIRWAIALHRSRGTRWGLLKYLELYTGQIAEIVEQRAANFVLGPPSQFGPAIALGHGNIPHTFTVTLRLPPVEAPSLEERKRLEEVRRKTIAAIIEQQKPAHTVYTLKLEPLENEEIPAEPEPPVPTKTDEVAAQAAIWFKLND
ncbi:MAG: hypothetical protein KDF65_12035 [Anaerolineae bacterium]|nr:hypothetical protein [Anaerolineae bacterium]